MKLLLETAASASQNKQPAARVYSHYSAPGGFSLILYWDTASIPMEGSETAMLIIEGLKPLGLLDHTVMIDEGSKEGT